ncbi:hypothetical protein [Raoultella ornithinolytica]|uniref:hypothetical protein n=1 Tax=Raoultella ornithinolytica TaxID=54291 RepID=UPI0019D4EC43|nr:hypothetical protein [Raoultella ornithinolytica]
MNIKEIGDVFHCDCGFSWHRGKNGNHNCADGLREKVRQLAAENVAIKAMNDCLSEELRGYESDGAFEGPKMHLLWWQVEFPATSTYLAGIKADTAAPLVSALTVIANSEQISGETVVCDFDSLISVAAGALRDYYAKQLREGAK